MFDGFMNWARRRNIAPAMSDTERAALDAGDVWLDGELFSGRPDFDRWLAEPYPRLSEAEQRFIDGPVGEVCSAMDEDWTVRHHDLSPQVWKLLRKHRFFGLALPEEYGGHGFSALAQSTIFGKLASCSMVLSSIVLIPNSVGPGELLAEVGTPEQRNYYLPRLARGEEIPCFALTEPNAGSDAASLQSRGEVFRAPTGELRLRLDWDKRYITLAPIATLLGLAFRLSDPEGLLGKGTDLGITCALVPTDLPGVEIGKRHDPMGIPFPNGPTRGHGVEISLDQIIGGPEFAGKGWSMLMEALSGGRAISLPATATVSAKHVARVTGAYAVVRQQFGLSIGRFAGIEEPLARIGAEAYTLEAARVFTCGAVDSGYRPSVISALMKYNCTETSRKLAVDGMDILGGAAICQGPRNLMAKAYVAAPIGITVEGANILTRTLITFGQGAIRCHPHAHELLESIRQRSAKRFRRAFLGQIWHGLRTTVRSTLLSLTRGRWARSPVTGPTAKYYRKLAWCSSRFALLTDFAMFTLGGKLKLRGKLTGRFADILSNMYLAGATLRRFEAEGRQAEDLPLVCWSVENRLAAIQRDFEGLASNFEVPVVGALLAGHSRFWWRLNPIATPPSDRLGSEVAQAVQKPGTARDRWTDGLYAGAESAAKQLETAFLLTVDSQASWAKVQRAVKTGTLKTSSNERLSHLLATAVEHGVINAADQTLIEKAAAARLEAIQVDEFDLDELRPSSESSQPIRPTATSAVA